MSRIDDERIDTLILCGGLGSRLGSVLAGRPKGLAEVDGRPFLDILVAELLRHGLRRLVLCTGYGAEQIADRYRDRDDAEFVLSPEPRPLGTGGAVAHALSLVRSDPFLVLNGDSFCRVRYGELLAAHERNGAALTIVVTPPADRTDVGAIRVDGGGRIVQFADKPPGPGAARGYANAGIYVMRREAMSWAPAIDAFSLELDLFPVAAASRRCFAYPVSGPLIDIGTPERLRAAQDLPHLPR